MNNRGIIGLAIALLLAAVFLPVAFNGFANSETGDKNQTFIAQNGATQTEDFQLTWFPVNDATAYVDATPIPQLPAAASVATDDGFYLFPTTGIVRLASTTKDEGDTLLVAYNHDRDFGLASGIWAILPVLGMVAVFFIFWKRGRT